MADDVSVPGQLGLMPAAMEDARTAALAELERLDFAALQLRTAALDDLHRAAAGDRSASRALDDAVAYARASGATWQQVADAVGLSKPAAWQRWSPKEGADRG